MAEYIKLRLTAAKVGVSMAFIALLGGLAERARANPSSAESPASAHFLTDTSSLPGGGASSLVVRKLDSALARLEHKLSTSFETTHKLNHTFLKIKSANTEFLKIRSANTSFLKIDDANANFLKIDDANASFLKIDDANNEFLKIDSTAVNANKLGGLTRRRIRPGRRACDHQRDLLAGGEQHAHLAADGSRGGRAVGCQYRRQRGSN